MGQSNKGLTKRKYIGGFAEYPGLLQTKAELEQFGPLPNNTWASGLGKNSGLNDQMTADTIGLNVIKGGSRKKQKRLRRKKSITKNIYLKKKV